MTDAEKEELIFGNSPRRFIVVRRISGVTKNKELWQPLSRPLVYQSALDWKDYQESIYRKKRALNDWNKIFLVEVFE